MPEVKLANEERDKRFVHVCMFACLHAPSVRLVLQVLSEVRAFERAGLIRESSPVTGNDTEKEESARKGLKKTMRLDALTTRARSNLMVLIEDSRSAM